MTEYFIISIIEGIKYTTYFTLLITVLTLAYLVIRSNDDDDDDNGGTPQPVF